MATIETRKEFKRGCGFRKPGGLYLVADGLARECGKLPLKLEICPCCGNGIKPSRGWTWVNGTTLLEGRECAYEQTKCGGCPLSLPQGRVGLLWIGEAFYKTPTAFSKEAALQGVSRRIKAVPRGFELGKTWVWFAHRKAIKNPDDSFSAAVVFVFKPQRIEYVVRGDETEEKLESLVERGITLVKIEKLEGDPIQKALWS